MALNFNIPIPGNEDSFGKGYQNVMQRIMDRKKQQQLDEHFKQELALRKQQMAQAGANKDLQRQIMMEQLTGLKHKNDPLYGLQQLGEKLKYIEGLGGEEASQGHQEKPMSLQDIMQSHEMQQGQGPLMIQEEPQKPMAQEMPVHHTLPGGINIEDVKKALTYQALGLKAPATGVNVLHGPARDAADLDKVKRQYGEDSEVYQNAKSQYDAALDAKKDLRDLRARTKAGLKVGEKEFFDENSGLPLGKEIPLTEKERSSEEGNTLFNELYPYVIKGGSILSGQGSIDRLQQAAAHYKTDPQARKILDDFLLAEKLLTATTVSEASTLNAGKTNQTYNLLRESLKAQDIPKLIKKLVTEYKLPPSASLKAGLRFQKLLSEARAKAKKGVPATRKLFYSPELQEHYDALKNEIPENKRSKSGGIVEKNGKKFKQINGEWYEIE